MKQGWLRSIFEVSDSYKELFNELFSSKKEDMCSVSPREISEFLAEEARKRMLQPLPLQILSL